MTPELLAAEPLRREIELLRQQLSDTEQALRAIRAGKVDSLVIHTRTGPELHCLSRSDVLYRVFFEELPHGAATLSSEGTILFCNRSLADLLRIPPQRLAGTRWPTWVAKPDQEASAELLRLPVGESHAVELTLVAADGTLIPIHLAASAYLADQVPLVCVIITDLTQQKRVEQELVTSEARYRSLVLATSQVVWTTNAAGVVTQDIPTWREYTGQTLEEMLGTGWLQALHPDDRAEIATTWTQAVAEQRLYTTETRIRRCDGQYRDFVVHGVPVRDTTGTVREWVGTCTDITGRKRTEEELRQALEKAERGAREVQEREQILTAMMDNIPLGITIADAPDVTIRLVSRYGRELLGKSAEELVNIPAEAHPKVWQIYHLDGTTLATPEELPLSRAVRKGEIVRGEEWLTTLWDGSHISILCTAAPIYNAAGHITGGVIGWQDITERKRAEDTLRLVNEIVEQSTQPFVIVELNGQIVRCNPAYERLTGYTAEELTAVTYMQLTPERWHKYEADLVSGLLQTGQTIHYEKEYRRKDGTIVPIELHVDIYRDRSGKIAYLFGFINDITERKQAEAEILALHAKLEQRVRDRTADLEAANKDLESFSYSVSHDLRAPLRAIDGFSGILQTDYAPQLSGEARHLLDLVRAAAQKMARLIDDLLGFSRLGRQSIRISTIQPGDLVAEVRTELAPALDGRHVEWQIGTLPPCQADPNLLRQVFQNLLDNAVKYTRDRDPARIEVGAHPGEQSGEVVYFVKDNGAGFDMKYADKLFGVFQRLHSEAEFPGTGVGLALVHRIIRMHGGRIWAEAAVNQGATFSFTLPAGHSPSPARTATGPLEGTPGSSATVAPRSGGPGLV